jgi:hypothetical protein
MTRSKTSYIVSRTILAVLIFAVASQHAAFGQATRSSGEVSPGVELLIEPSGQEVTRQLWRVAATQKIASIQEDNGLCKSLAWAKIGEAIHTDDLWKGGWESVATTIDLVISFVSGSVIIGIAGEAIQTLIDSQVNPTTPEQFIVDLITGVIIEATSDALGGEAADDAWRPELGPLDSFLAEKTAAAMRDEVYEALTEASEEPFRASVPAGECGMIEITATRTVRLVNGVPLVYLHILIVGDCEYKYPQVPAAITARGLLGTFYHKATIRLSPEVDSEEDPIKLVYSGRVDEATSRDWLEIDVCRPPSEAADAVDEDDSVSHTGSQVEDESTEGEFWHPEYTAPEKTCMIRCRVQWQDMQAEFRGYEVALRKVNQAKQNARNLRIDLEIAMRELRTLEESLARARPHEAGAIRQFVNSAKERLSVTQAQLGEALRAIQPLEAALDNAARDLKSAIDEYLDCVKKCPEVVVDDLFRFESGVHLGPSIGELQGTLLDIEQLTWKPPTGAADPSTPKESENSVPASPVSPGVGFLHGFPTPLANPPAVAVAGRAIETQLLIIDGPPVHGPSLPENVPGGAVTQAPILSLTPRESPTEALLLIRGTGQIGGEAVSVTVYQRTGGPIAFAGEGLVAEPVDLSEEVGADLERSLLQWAGGRLSTLTLNAYCLEMLLDTPPAGTLFRIVPQEFQVAYTPIRQVLSASRQASALGLLSPDSDPQEYFHSIRQWAIWTRQEGLDERSFSRSFIERSKELFEDADRAWNSEVESQVRKILPNRWRDIESILRLTDSGSEDD